MKRLTLLLGSSLALVLSGCIDKDYDLTNIDTTSEFQVNDLILPIQIDPVKLGDIITVKPGDKIKEVTLNGKTFYALEASGEFESDSIRISDILNDMMDDREDKAPLSPLSDEFKLPEYIEYRFTGDGLSIPPIYLDKIPEFLAGPETNLILANPQVYLSLTNPVGTFGLEWMTGLEVVTGKESDQDTHFDLGRDVVVPGKSGIFNYVMAPDAAAVNECPEGYEKDLNKISYPHLGNILAGNGLPDWIEIRLIDPMIPKQPFPASFPIEEDIVGIKGKYTLLVPLALEGESKIVYSKTESGWWSEDLEGLVIRELSLTAKVTNETALGAVAAVYPIDREGNMIENVEIIPVDLPQNAEGMELQFKVAGKITDLDGVIIKAIVKPDNTTEPLSPGQIIMLENIRVKVSGNYTKKF